ncbi:3-oxoacyl-[acyl-carrier-protein] reductase [Sporolactobacillus laevolacticus]|uniref:3-oxoacyl-[acyl-carrier-protein] reductase n=1 Tax=Sporolactobacillus laevolacticus DSM 442 TaxID=1395513 RepID=V6IZZ0_9BACL|nr:3-oxoacyl-[acyl-carrier-protein] reductase [Sporolactobacillus laevolacticus]EST13095.1 3-ketoacyl-ACP reductase [Sporolactobacillus laevolacticus DSM 442]MDN3954029.1 3-oxoacyl-[acyl-carrier-protein] reductase [Sporolactobacillus laevolacticus]
MGLQGKVALVTGASRGIGRAIAIALAKQGASIIVNYSGNKARAEETAADIRAAGAEALVWQSDISDEQSVQDMVKQSVDHFGHLDIVVNNAGITRDGLLMRMKETDWDAVLNTNLKGVFLVTKAALRPMMRQKQGRIINIASVVGILGNPGQANYVAAKAGLIGLTKATAREVASRGITVNAVAPGFIVTEMTDQLPEDVKEKMLSEIPLGKLGTPENVADVVSFLASDESRYMTGQTLSVDGGMAMQ